MNNREAIWRIKVHMIAHHMEEPRAILITEALEMAIEALENQEAEKEHIEHIIKALEDEKDKCVKQKRQTSIYDSYLKAATYEVAMDNAIEIVKRGGKHES